MIQHNDFAYEPLPAGPPVVIRRSRSTPDVAAQAASDDSARDIILVDAAMQRAAKRRCIEAPLPSALCEPALRLPGLPAPAPQGLPPPRTLGQSLAACGRLMGEPAYRAGLGVMLACGVGNGLLDSAYLMVMDHLGSQQHSLPIMAMKVVSAMQAASAVASMIVAHHQRDLEDANLAPRHDVPRCYLRGLAVCGVVDLANSLAMAGSVFAFQRGLLHWPALVGALTVAKTLDACKDTRDYGFWSCLKVHLGDADARREQRNLNRTLMGVEMGLLSAIYYSQSLGVYALALRYADSNLLGVGAAVLVGGGLLASVPKLYFWVQSRRRYTAMPDTGCSV